MQQHAVPQNITGFEFKLIGFLTLRQFGYLGVAAIWTFILYSAKIPLLLILILAGPLDLFALALAFLPVNGQPFEHAFVAFLKTIYSPNTRVWHREPKVLGFLEPQFSIYLQSQNQKDIPKVYSDRSKLTRYLQSQKKPLLKSNVDINEERRLGQLPFAPMGVRIEPKPSPDLQNLSPSTAENIASGTPHFQRTETSAPNLTSKTGGEQ